MRNFQTGPYGASADPSDISGEFDGGKVKHVNFREKNPLESMTQWECVNCKGVLFRLSANGEVFCGSCRARIKTLAVVQK